MLLNRNIKENNKNAFYHLVIGLIFIGMTLWVYFKGENKPNGVDQFDWVYIFIFGMVGVFFSFKGLSSIFRKAYILVDEERIAIKPDETTKSETILRNDIEAIRQVEKNFEILKKDGSSYIIYFSYFKYENAGDLKEAIIDMASTKGISIQE